MLQVTILPCRIVAGRRFPPVSTTLRSFSSSRSLHDSHDDPTTTAAESHWNKIKDPPDSAAQEIAHAAEESGEAVTNLEGQNSDGKVGSDAAQNIQDGDGLAKITEKSSYGSATRRQMRHTMRKGREFIRPTPPSWFLDRNVVLQHELPSKDTERLVLKDISPESGAGRISPNFRSKSYLSDQSPPTSTGLQGSEMNGPLAPAAAISTDHSLSDGNRKEDNVEGESGGSAGIELSDTDNKGDTITEIFQGHTSAGDQYEISGNVFAELSVTVSGALRPAQARYADSYPASKPHLLLQSPRDGGMYFLDSVVDRLAMENKADIIRLDAQDIAEIGGDDPIEVTDNNAKSLRSLSYETHTLFSKQQEIADQEEAMEESEDADDIEDSPMPQGRSRQPNIAAGKGISGLQMYVVGKFPGLFGGSGGGAGKPSGNLEEDGRVSFDAKMNAIIESCLDGPSTKRSRDASAKAHEEPTPNAASQIENEETSTTDPDSIKAAALTERCGTIIHIRDYPEINATLHGGTTLTRIHDVVRRRRKIGHRLLIIGTSSSEALIPAMTKAAFKTIQLEPEKLTRTVIVPCISPSAESIFALDEKTRVQSINMRHLQDMLRRLAPTSRQVQEIVAVPSLELDSASTFLLGLDETVWSFEAMHRLATLTLGLTASHTDAVTTTHITEALRILDSSDSAKATWLEEESRQEQRSLSVGVHASSDSTDEAVLLAKQESEERLKRLRKTCTTHEKKLLSGVVDPANIRTTFGDVHAPLKTIDALRTLTSLSLIRPDAFTYGVLASDKISGLLLYGPPGTGKTLLAKAVAKESGATVLEVSGSEVYDMYVGEGEKNVKAIFTLAKKLTPCVVFIDEADAIFGSRGTSSNRTSHRELINQFLKEWDGMNDASAFVMVATNRPFDLDDAVLRRLPRRLLVDLPTEQDREKILAIHLKGEMLDESVSLPKLASQTPFFSGSDLKNLCVSAALTCVKEENAAARAADTTTAANTDHTASTTPLAPSSTHKYPSKRILRKSHFDVALEEISASVSEDMSSLAAIRKFDERFGERAGRRKKVSGYGFGTKVGDAEKEKDSEGVRVRPNL
ncbi:hypothetical protein MMC25_002780 [Agyrium rufum]|nr:hypothetical protein [Agyrium rufum]